MRMFCRGVVVVLVGLGLSGLSLSAAAEPAVAPLKVLFLGDRGHHHPADRAKQLIPVLAKRGIDIRYTEDVHELNAANLAKYKALIIYANIDRIEPDEEKALLEYVRGGGGFVPLHCASFCFLNSPAYVALVGAQFKRHGTGVFRTVIAEPEHPIMKGFGGFESWDETYVHHRHNTRGRTVLEYRVDKEGREPYTWVRTEGKGRVFYTAWGHDQRTWANPGFQNLVERGIRWAAGTDPGVVPPFPPATQKSAARSAANSSAMAPTDPLPPQGPRPTGLKPFEYVPAKIAFYPPDGGHGVWNQMQLPLSPAESAPHLVLPKGFEAELFASEPDISGKPISMNWDERGRLWILETLDYPNAMQPAGQGHDRIVICEDTHGTGRADKFTVFADKLSIPTSLTFSHGGVIVHQAPVTLFLKDTTGGDKANVRKVLFSGWGTHDTHAGPSNLHYGLDNWIWGSVGYSGFSGQVGGEHHHLQMGFYRFRADGSKLEYLCTTSNNTWGLGFTEEGCVFGSTANNCPSVYMAIPNRYYETVPGMAPKQLADIAETKAFHPITNKIRQVDCHGHYTAGAGHAIYTGRAYPPAYWNDVAFVAEPTGHLVGQFRLERHGSQFVSRDAIPLVASDDEWTAPIMAEVGPDGNVWVIDWYNYIVQHNPIPRGFVAGKGGAYETPLRDKHHARIYRIVYRGSGQTPPPAPQPLRLDRATPAELVATLKNPTMLWRLHAQRLLVERGRKDVVPALIKLVEDRSVDAVGLNVGAIHALWTLHGLGALDGSDPTALAAALGALRHPSGGVRRNAVQVIPRTDESVSAILSAGLLSDGDAQVRLMAFLALSEMPRSESAGSAIFAALLLPENSEDRWIPDAATIAAARHDAGFLKAALSESSSAAIAVTSPPAKSLETPKKSKSHHHTGPVVHVPVVKSGLSPVIDRALGLVAASYARRGAVDSIVGTLASLKGANPQFAATLLDGLAAGWPQGRSPNLTPADRAQLSALMSALPPDLKGRLLALADRFGERDIFSGEVAGVLKNLAARLADASLPSTERADAAERLVRLADNADTVRAILERIDPQASPLLVQGLLEALSQSRRDATGSLLAARFGQITPASRRAAISVLLLRPAWCAELLSAVEQHAIGARDLSDQAWAQLTSHRDPQIASRARKLSGGALVIDADRQKIIDRLLPDVQHGNPTKGLVIFQKKCAQCHCISGAGAHIGPELTGCGRRPKGDLLIDIIDPNRSVEANFRQWTVETRDGLTYNGLLVAESQTTVEILDADGKHHVVPRENVEFLKESKLSLMPVGLEKDLASSDLGDLLEFLSRSKEPRR